MHATNSVQNIPPQAPSNPSISQIGLRGAIIIIGVGSGLAVTVIHIHRGAKL